MAIPMIFGFFLILFGALLKAGTSMERALAGGEATGLMTEVVRAYMSRSGAWILGPRPALDEANNPGGSKTRRLRPLPHVLATVFGPFALFLIQAITGVALGQVDGWVFL